MDELELFPLDPQLLRKVEKNRKATPRRRQKLGERSVFAVWI